MACSSAGQCAAKATGLFVWWMLGYLHGPGANQTTGLAYRNATMPGGTFLASKAVALGPNSSTAAVAHSYSSTRCCWTGSVVVLVWYRM